MPINFEEIQRKLNILLDEVGGISDEKRKIINDKINSYRIDDLINAAITIISDNFEAHKKLCNVMDFVNDGMYAEMYREGGRPLIITHPDDNNLMRVFPNIILSNNSLNELQEISVFDVNVIKEFIDKYREDIAHPEAKNKWQPLERGVARLNQVLDMPFARGFTRYTCLSKKYTDAQIRDFADGISDYYKPIEISYAETPEDFTIMYGSGPSSCMAYTHFASWPALTAAGLCPPSFYGYFPLTRGAYSVKGGKVVARVVLFKNTEKDNTWYYGSVYANTPEYREKFVNSLQAAGYKELSQRLSASHKPYYTPPDGFTFKIPGVFDKDRKAYLAPWPYFDNMDYNGRGFYARFDTKTNEFEITYIANKKDERRVEVHSQGGFLLSTNYTKRECEHCGSTTSKEDNWISTHDGHLYCSENCATNSGYIKVANVDGNYIWQQDNEFTVVTEDGNLKFTTLAAAERNRYFLPADELGIVQEETDRLVRYDGRDIFSGDGTRYKSPNGENIQTVPITMQPSVRTIELEY